MTAPTSSPSPDAPAMLPPKALRRRNKELAALGLRICRTHQGVALPLTSRYFYRVSRNSPRFQTECKACANARSARRKLERFHSDADYRVRVLKQSAKSADERRAHRREIGRDYDRRRKAAQFSAILQRMDGR